MKRLTLASPSNPASDIPTRLEGIRVSFEKNRHRYSIRRRAAIEDMLALVTSEFHINALDETLNAWLPQSETFAIPRQMFPRAIAA